MTKIKTGVFIGRFQVPEIGLHDGHKACIDKILEECDACVIYVRETHRDESNPLTFLERYNLIRKHYPDPSKVKIIQLDDPGCDLTVYYGRKVGYNIEQIKLDEATENISASQIRKEQAEKKDD